MSPLSLPETLLLLGFDANDATTREGLSLSYAVAGAQLHELALAGRVTVEPERVTLVDAKPTGDSQLDDLLASIASTSDRPRKPRHWVMKRKSRAVPEYAQRLVAARALSRRRARLLGIVPYTTLPVVDQALRAQLLEEIGAALAAPAPPPERAAALIALISVAGGRGRLIGDPEQQQRAERIAADDVVASAVKRAVDAVRRRGGDGGGMGAAGG
ncbi:MAG: GPP34 family phosphoprotein [Actinomycetota bacterium]|nr:GPP34 family phosphoprotein [Actinomycetota bacterium]